MALAGTLVEAVGWRPIFVTLGLPGIGLALIVRLTLREPVRGRRSVDRSFAVPARSARRSGSYCVAGTYRFLMIFGVLNGFVQYGLTQWCPPFYEREFALRPSTFGMSLGLAIGFGSGIGLLIGGVTTNKMVQRDVRLPLVMSAVVTALAIPAALGSLFILSTISSMLLVATTGFFWGMSASPVVANIYGVTAPRMRATAGALCPSSFNRYSGSDWGRLQ